RASSLSVHASSPPASPSPVARRRKCSAFAENAVAIAAPVRLRLRLPRVQPRRAVTNDARIAQLLPVHAPDLVVVVVDRQFGWSGSAAFLNKVLPVVNIVQQVRSVALAGKPISRHSDLLWRYR